MIKIAVCIASTGHCKTQFAVSLSSLMAYFPSKRLAEEEPDQYIGQFLVESSGLAHNQHQLVTRAKEWGATHILWLEDDMQFPADALHRLFAWRQKWVGANYPIRTWPPVAGNTAVGLNGKRLETKAASKGLEQVAYTGYGVTLMDISIFDQVEAPWFELAWLGDGNYATTDAYLAEKVRKTGIQIYCDHDLSKEIGHVGHHVFTVGETEAWNEWRKQNGE